MYSMRVPEADAETRLAQPPCNPNSRKSDSQPPPVDPFPADGTRPPPAQRNQRLKIATQAVPAVKDQASHNRISRQQKGDALRQNVATGPVVRLPHFPIMEADGIITSVWNNAVVFRPRAGELGVLLITRRFDNDILLLERENEMPQGKRTF
jgi:hypothetical protein